MRTEKTECRIPNCQRPHVRGECDKNCYYNTRQVMTNADRIRAMSDGELAQFFGNVVDCDTCPLDGKMGACPCGCEATWGRWLKQEADNG